MSARINFGVSTNIGNVADPLISSDAATKSYVDNNRPGQEVPIISFTTLSGSNNAYSDPRLSFYTDSTYLQVSLDGIVLQNFGTFIYYTLSGNNLTIVPFTNAGRSLQVAPSVTGTGGSGIGGVSSVGLTMPPGFSVIGSPVTGNSTFIVSYNGQIPGSALGSGNPSNTSYLRGDSSWQTLTLDAVIAGGSSTNRTASFAKLTVSNTPSDPTDVVRLSDLQASGLISFRPSVNLVSLTSVGTTYNAGVLTGTAPLVIDGVSVTAGMRVLLIGQGIITGAAFSVSNGPYVVTDNPDSGTFTLTRATDELKNSAYYFVTQGSLEDNTSWVISTTGVIIVGVTPLVFTQFFAAPNASTTVPLAIGTGSVGTSTNYARADHVHPFSLTNTGSGNASYTQATGVLNIPSLPTFPTGAIVGTTDTQTLTNKTYTGGSVSRILEPLSSVTPSLGILNVDVSLSSIFRVTALSGATTLTINNVAAQFLGDLQSFTLTILSDQTATSNYINNISISGATTATVRWSNGIIPNSGSNTPATDLYSITIIRITVGVYRVLASRAGY